MMGLDKNADLYNYLTKKRPTDWDDRTNSGFEVQKNMSSEKDLADGGYSSNGFTSTVGKSIPKRFKTNKSSIVVTEPYGSKKVKQYKELNKNIAYKKDDIADLQNDVTSMQNNITKKQNDINSTQDEINQRVLVFGTRMPMNIKRKTEKYEKCLILPVCKQFCTTLARQCDSGFKLPEGHTL